MNSLSERIFIFYFLNLDDHLPQNTDFWKKGKIKEEKASIPKAFYLNSTNGSSSRKPPTMTQVDVSQYMYYKQSQRTDMKNMQSQPPQKKISCVPPKLLATLIL